LCYNAETLRKYPPVVFIDRVCSKSIDLPEYDLKLEKGIVIGLPFYGLHHDPEYFPEPDRFDPERFNEANKHNIKPFSYLPFGAGPRNCVGKLEYY
jgi:cytochrome P450